MNGLQQRKGLCVAASLAGAVDDALGEIAHIAEVVSSHNRSAGDSRVRYPIVAIVDSRLQGVTADTPRDVVDNAELLSATANGQRRAHAGESRRTAGCSRTRRSAIGRVASIRGPTGSTAASSSPG